MDKHFCKEHQTKFYKNEKTDENGQTNTWYSHKLADGSGFCQEKNQPQEQNDTQSSIFACNAMNNAVALASAGKIDMQKIGETYKKLLGELSSTNL